MAPDPHLVIDGPLRSRIMTYVRERRCPSGGYCFYRLDEPNAADTYYALRILSLLGEEISDEETLEFLKELQSPEGSYSSYTAALSAVRGLRMLGENPLHDLMKWISHPPPFPDPRTQVIEAFSLFDPLLTWISLYSLHDAPVPDGWRSHIIESILRFRTSSGGFGSPVATLQDTWQASEVLLMLRYPSEKVAAAPFIRSCEDPEFGFLRRPGIRPPYLEHIFAGLRLSALLMAAPRYPEACRAFLERCIHHSGGFVRSVFGGSPTLEFTARAVESLAILAENNHRLRRSCG